MVVPVLITSCQVSENPKKGPEIAQTTTVPRARTNTQALPTSREPTFATSANSLLKTPGFLVARAPEVGAGEPFFSSGVLGTVSDPTAIRSLHNEQPASEFPVGARRARAKSKHYGRPHARARRGGRGNRRSHPTDSDGRCRVANRGAGGALRDGQTEFRGGAHGGRHRRRDGACVAKQHDARYRIARQRDRSLWGCRGGKSLRTAPVFNDANLTGARVPRT